ncbi:hypothetical protein ANAEL_00516 [Anaerolineales bacterium]|nr:hypothetical protein ANAEL_00516 [Anaerolineales bacterium]
MLDKPRTYRHSLVEFILGMVILVIVGISILPAFLRVLLIGIVFLSVLYLITQKMVISDEGIFAQTILDEKFLRWDEISRVSGRGDGIKLYNFNGDVTIAPSPNLFGYEEIVYFIGNKRPDLFDPQEYGVMKQSASVQVMLDVLAVASVGVLLVVGVLFFYKRESSAFLLPLSLLVFIPVGMFAVISFFQVQAVILDGKYLHLKYLLQEKTLSADEIESISLCYFKTWQTRGMGIKNYFIMLVQKHKETIRISRLSPCVPIVYLVLKNWHKKNVQIKTD